MRLHRNRLAALVADTPETDRHELLDELAEVLTRTALLFPTVGAPHCPCGAHLHPTHPSPARVDLQCLTYAVTRQGATLTADPDRPDGSGCEQENDRDDHDHIAFLCPDCSRLYATPATFDITYL